MSLFQRARSIHRERGFLSLARKSPKFLANRVLFDKFVWKLIDKGKAKKVLANSRTLTTLYFALHQTFYIEQQTMLHGQATYHEEEEQRENPRHRIIRNIHRIEKGLSMKNRRSVFAEGYIKETVHDVISAWKRNEHPDDQLYWAVDVLSKYFETVEVNDNIRGSKIIFESFLADINYEPGNRTPKPRQEFECEPVEHEDLKKLAEQRSSTRWFKQRKVPRERIDDALEVAIQSPTACNRQPFEFRIYDDDELIKEIVELPMGTKGYRENVPCLAVIVGKQRAYFHNRDRHVVYIDSSLAAMSFQFALETLGLASCCINWPAIPWREREMAELINLDNDEEVIMLMAIGYPDEEGMVPYSEKKDLDSIRKYNKL
ncbi:nitroreductase family protein [Natronosalvus vescus]|uniref:nitroreductase family protein n=1 Tax=Natronosalvus vescus TaxID=2953881 RepID=UPI002091BCBB|nr:nitroreductase family protein [Natronosalvus vescus]